MARGMNAARRDGTTIFRVQAVPVKAAETFKNRAVVTLDPAGTGFIQEVASGATAPNNKILGLALNGAASGPGFNVSDSNVNNSYGIVSPQGAAATNGISSVILADQQTEFSARGVSGGTDPVTPLLSHIGLQYGIAKDANGNWYVNIADTVNVCVQITDIRPDLSMNLFLFKFIEALMIMNP
jgi:hypothetical protein